MVSHERRRVVECALIAVIAASGFIGATGAPGLRPWSMAMSYGFTTEAIKTRKELAAKQENSLMPDAKDLEDVPFLSEVFEFFQSRFGKRVEPPPSESDKMDLSNFPLHGCKVRGNLAFCRAPVSVSKDGFDWNADVAFLVKYHATLWVDPKDKNPPIVPWENIRPNVTEALFVDCVKQWAGMLPARRPAMNFFLKRELPPAPKEGAAPKIKVPLFNLPVQIVAIAPGPEAARRLPMELAVRFDDLEIKPKNMKAKVRFECKAMGKSVANVTAGSFCIGTD